MSIPVSQFIHPPFPPAQVTIITFSTVCIWETPRKVILTKRAQREGMRLSKTLSPHETLSVEILFFLNSQ